MASIRRRIGISRIAMVATVLISARASAIVSTMSTPRLPFAILRDDGVVRGECHALVPWWSITKPVLAAAVLRLVDLGAVGLDDRFKDWPFTVRQLLQHTSGLRDYGGPTYQRAVAAGDAVWPIDDLMARRNARELAFVSGQGWAYSNIGYLFLRQLIEATTKTGIDAALQRLVFAPLHITRTKIATTPDDLAQTLRGNRSNYDPGWVYHGLLIGPPADAVTFLARLLGGDLLSTASLAAMQEARNLGGALPDRPWTETGYGLGLMIGTMRDAGRAAGHSGVGPDSVSALYAFMDLPGRPVVAAFAQGTDQGIAEFETARLALASSAGP